MSLYCKNEKIYFVKCFKSNNIEMNFESECARQGYRTRLILSSMRSITRADCA